MYFCRDGSTMGSSSAVEGGEISDVFGGLGVGDGGDAEAISDGFGGVLTERQDLDYCSTTVHMSSTC